MKFISSIFIIMGMVVAAQVGACPTCIGTEHRENTPAFFSKEFYQPGQSYTAAQTKKSGIKPTAQTTIDKEEVDQAASMAAVLNDAL